MNYIESNLRKDEQVVIRAKISWLTLIAPALSCIIGWVIAFYLKGLELDNMPESMATILGYVAIVIGVLFTLPLVKRILFNLTTHLAVTNKRVIGKVGVLKIDTIDYPIDKVDNVSFKAGFFGNIFKYATVQIGSVSGEKKLINSIGNAQQFKNNVTDAIEKHAEEARRAQAAEIAAAMANK
ncbi:MAG: PH domain-containing protein [Clostridiales bacterium]|nr:PH domain-containing protein [Clostridiales bacterium]